MVKLKIDVDYREKTSGMELKQGFVFTKDDLETMAKERILEMTSYDSLSDLHFNNIEISIEM